ncbi:MAG: bifunctional hydroxymethylpyrimidine kinase/phosphomethylpyrimidine kinase [Crenarchaeota archaeon]|nr:bifunctional hydroxymethylpyrimidine kinase/phosphomethylpyrimidine kinase [Thermoproteota archaeon]MCR8501094.1 bifunctional hydroxymethylpyrimidine kinase/phosphomethylpyrimidine kinase [Thermoproteota archaeon]
MKKALTIAGVDSGGGAGIIADIKTFSALNVWGMAVVTSVTAQNTTGVYAVQDISPEIISAQIRAIIGDIGLDAAKTGMLKTSEIIRTVARELSEVDVPLVVDPVMVAQTGAPLMEPDAKEVLVKELLPLALVVTPNRYEAEALSGMEIRSIRDAEKAAKLICEKYNPEAVIVKGGHLEEAEAIDVLYYNGEYHYFKTPRLKTKNTHGSGCTFSAAITAELAKGKKLPDAVKTAKEFMYIAIKYGLALGRGRGPVNHMAWIYREAERYTALVAVREFVEKLESLKEMNKLIPEVGMNVAYALNHAVDKNDIIALPGRIRATPRGPKACAPPDFGASQHLASYILVSRDYDQSIRAAINIKFSEETIEKLRKLGLKISSYDRMKEPPEIKAIEGATIPWGTKQAIEALGGQVPDVIYHRGDVGKEPMIVILCRDLNELMQVLEKVLN